METKHLDKKIEELETLNDVYGALNLREKDKLKEYKEIKKALTIPVVVRQSEQLKDKETPTFEVWITQDIKRMEIYATFLDGFANGNLGNLYREYVNTTL